MNDKHSSEYYERIKKLTCINQNSYKNLFKKNFEPFNDNSININNNVSRQFRTNNRLILPKIKNRTNQSFGKNDDIYKKDFYSFKK